MAAYTINLENNNTQTLFCTVNEKYNKTEIFIEVYLLSACNENGKLIFA